MEAHFWRASRVPSDGGKAVNLARDIAAHGPCQLHLHAGLRSVAITVCNKAHDTDRCTLCLCRAQLTTE